MVAAGELNQLINSALNDPIVLGALAAGAIGYYLYTEMDKRVFQTYERTPLEKKVVPDLKYRIKKLGQTSQKALTKGAEIEFGGVQRFLKTQQPTNVNLHPEKDPRPDKEDVEMETVYAFMLAPRTNGIIGKINYAAWYLTDYIFGRNMKTEIYVVSESTIDFKDHFSFNLDRDVDFRRFGGVLVEKDLPAENVVYEVGMVRSQEKLINSFDEYIKYINLLNEKHSAQVDKIEKKEEAKKRKTLEDVD